MNELLWIAMMLFTFSTILIFYYFFGKIALFVWIPIATIVANIQVMKNIDLFGISATLGNILYASTFLVTDILSENYGKKDAKNGVIFGFFALLTSTTLLQFMLLFIPAESDFANPHLQAIFSFMPRLVLASLTAFFVSQIHDIWAFQFWKKLLPNLKFLWVRNNLSTMVSQLLDTIIFVAIAFWGKFPTTIFLQILVSTYFIKFIVALADTPVIYLATFIHKKRWEFHNKILN